MHPEIISTGALTINVMATIRKQLLKRLPQDIAIDAIHNTVVLNQADYVDHTPLSINDRNVLTIAFVWADSPEGHEYWMEIEKKYFLNYKWYTPFINWMKGLWKW